MEWGAGSQLCEGHRAIQWSHSMVTEAHLSKHTSDSPRGFVLKSFKFFSTIVSRDCFHSARPVINVAASLRLR